MPSFLAGVQHAVSNAGSWIGDHLTQQGSYAEPQTLDPARPEDYARMAGSYGLEHQHVFDPNLPYSRRAQGQYLDAGAPSAVQSAHGIIPGTGPGGVTHIVPGINNLAVLQHLAALKAQQNPGAILQQFHGKE